MTEVKRQTKNQDEKLYQEARKKFLIGSIMESGNDPHGNSRLRDLAPKAESVINPRLFQAAVSDNVFEIISKVGIVIEPNAGNGLADLIWQIGINFRDNK